MNQVSGSLTRSEARSTTSTTMHCNGCAKDSRTRRPGGLLSLKCLALPLLEEGSNLTASLCKRGKALPFAERTRSLGAKVAPNPES